MSALSPAELACLYAWRAHEDAHGDVPSRKVLAARLGVSAARVKDLLTGLVDKGELEPDDVGPIGPQRDPKRPHGHGLTPREQEIMDLSDADLSAEAIARELRIDLGYVRATIRNFDFAHCWHNSDRADRKTREADRRYQAALAASGGRYR